LASSAAWLATLALPSLRPLSARLGAAWPRLLAFMAAAALAAGVIPLAVSQIPRTGAMEVDQVLPLQLTGNTVTASTYSDIFAVQGTTGADGGFQRLIRLMDRGGLSFYSLIGPRDVVLIKINSQWDERGGTNTDLVRSIIESILEHPAGFAGEIVIADNGQAQYGSAGGGGSLDWAANNALDRTQSMRKVAESFQPRHRVSAVLWDRITTTRVAEYSEGDTRDGYVVDAAASPRTGIIVSYPKFTTAWSTQISFRQGVWDPVQRSYDPDRLKVINVPVLKSHMIYGVTASVKHYMGVGSDKLTRSAHRSVGLGGMGTEMAQTRVPTLNIIDAIWVNAAPGRGPRTRYGDAVRLDIIAAGRDPVALDAWAARNILIPTARKLGDGGLDSLDPDNTRAGSFGSWLRLSMDELVRAGHQSTLDLKGVNVSVDPPGAGGPR
jgi:hypothetical protein